MFEAIIVNMEIKNTSDTLQACRTPERVEL